MKTIKMTLLLCNINFLALVSVSAANIALNGSFDYDETKVLQSFPSSISTLVTTTDVNSVSLAEQLRNFAGVGSSSVVTKQSNLGVGQVSPSYTIPLIYWAQESGAFFAGFLCEIDGARWHPSNIFVDTPQSLMSRYTKFLSDTEVGSDVSGVVTVQSNAADSYTSTFETVPMMWWR